MLCEGGPEVAGEALLLGTDWWERVSEDPAWPGCRNGVGDRPPWSKDLCQRMMIGVLRCGSVLEEGLDCGEVFGRRVWRMRRGRGSAEATTLEGWSGWRALSRNCSQSMVSS